MGCYQELVGGGLLSGISSRWAVIKSRWEVGCYQELVAGGLLSGVSGRWAAIRS